MNEHLDVSSDAEFETRAQQAFHASVNRLDAASRSKLNQARQRAMAEASQGWRWQWARVGLQSRALAGLAALGMAVFFIAPNAALHYGAESAIAEEMELLSTNDSWDLYAEEPEFFEWAGQDSNAAAPNEIPGST